jgi:transposase
MQKESRFYELIRLQQDSGLTVREFCSNEGIASATYYYWRKKLYRKGKKDFIPLIVKSSESSLTQAYNRNSKHCDYQPGKNAENDVLLELVYPNGTILRVKNDLDLVHLRALIHLYD